jgi:hypothetical protein
VVEQQALDVALVSQLGVDTAIIGRRQELFATFVDAGLHAVAELRHLQNTAPFF